MGVIMHNNIPYGGGSSIEPNPQESATEQLETLGIDGDVYEVTDANAAREVQPTITEAQNRTNLADGDDVPTIFGKIKKFFSDLKDLAFIGKDGASSTKYLRGDGTWQNFPTIPTVNDATLTIQKNGTAVETFTANSSTNKTANITVPTKVSDLTDDVVSGHYLPLTGGTLTGNLNVSNNGASDTALYVRGNSQGAYIGFHNANGGTTYGYYGVRNDNKPYFYSGTGKRIVLADELPTKLSDLTNDLNKIKDIGNSADTTFAFSKTGLGYNDYTWLAGWNGYELRAVGKTQFAQAYVEGRLSNSDAYNALGHGYYGGNAGSIWRIAFPDATVNVWNMINMTVSVRQTWNPPRGGKVMIHAYHNATSPYTWQGLKAEVIGSLTDDIKVYASDGKYIYIAGFSGGYTTLNIDDLLIGDQSRSQDFRGTVVDMVSELPTTYQTASMIYYVRNGVTNTFTNNTDNAPVLFKDGNPNGSGATSAGYVGKDGTIYGYIGVTSAKKPYFYDTARREIITSATIGSQSVDKATKDGDGNTISSTYLKNSNVLMKNGDANVSPAGYRNIGGTNDYITLSEAGTYLITAWAMFKGGTGNKAVLICRASDNAAYGQSWESSTINQSYPKTFTCFHVATVTSTTLYFRARVYTENTDVYGGISGGIYAIKVS